MDFPIASIVRNVCVRESNETGGILKGWMTPRKKHQTEIDIITLIKGQVCNRTYLALLSVSKKQST